MTERGSRRTKLPLGAAPRRSTPPLVPTLQEDEPHAAPLPLGPRAERRLETILRSLPPKELAALAERNDIVVDPKKRLDEPAQVARALVRLPEIRELDRLPPASATLLRRIAEAGGALLVGSVPAGLDALVRRGLVFARLAEDEIADEHRRQHGARAGGHVLELVLPTAFLVQLKAAEGDDPRSLRALLAEAPFETASAVATHYLGRPSTPPIALSLEPAWEVLGDAAALPLELSRISHQERRLLDQLEQVGGEVDTQELMDLEREPMRIRGAYGVTAGRRGAAFSLEKRGFLFPLHPNRYVLPTEVAALVGAERRGEREQRRERIREQVVDEDHLPRRARFSADPAPFVLGLALAIREASAAGELKPGLGTPRSLVGRLAQRFGRVPEETGLLVALSRATGLWDASASSLVARPGTLRVGELQHTLFETWRRGGAWDEARSDAELLRLAPDARDPSPVGVLREIVLEALVDLAEGQWVPFRALSDYIEADPRMGGLRRLFERWAKRVVLEPPSESWLVERILLESLPALGLVDVGGAVADRTVAVGLDGLAVRFNSRGRELVTVARHGPERETSLSAGRAAASEFGADLQLRIGSAARVAEVLDLAAFVDLVTADARLEVEISATSLGRGLSAGLDAADMRRRVEVLAALSPAAVRLFEEASVVLGRGTFTPAAGFLWVDDVELRELLRTRQGTADLFLEPSPEGGLLVAPGIEPERVARRCRALGVEVQLEEPVMRARRSTAPPPRQSDSGRRPLSWRPPALGESSSRD